MNLQEAAEQVLLIGNDLPERGQVSGKKCPFCDSADNSLSVTRRNGYLYYLCHRDRCGTKGRLAVGIGAPADVKVDTELAMPVLQDNIPDDVLEHLRTTLYLDNIDMARLRAKWSAEKNRLAMPILNVNGGLRGYVLRSFSKGVKPKALTVVKQPNSCKLAWYPNRVHGMSTILVVEDQLSAVRAANHVTSVALLGTHMSDADAAEIANFNPRKVLICLDKDATSKGIELQRKYGQLFNDCKVIKPPADLKNIAPKDLQPLLEGYTA